MPEPGTEEQLVVHPVHPFERGSCCLPVGGLSIKQDTQTGYAPERKRHEEMLSKPPFPLGLVFPPARLFGCLEVLGLPVFHLGFWAKGANNLWMSMEIRRKK